MAPTRMIIKRETRSRMPNLQRCPTVAAAFSTGDEDGGGEAGDGCRKRKREGGGFHPLEMLGGAAAARSELAEEGCCPPRVFVDDDHEDFSSVAAPASSRCSEVSICSGEVESESRIGPRREEDAGRAAGDEEAPAGAAGPRPPVVKTSRGRVQVLPSRFNDSVLLDPWKKEKQKSKALNAGPCGGEGPHMAKEAYGPKLIPDAGDPNLLGLVKEQCYSARGIVGMKKSTSRSTLTSLHEAALETQIRPQKRMKVEPQDRLEPMLRERWLSLEHPERRKDFYFLEDFVCGDIVWAKSGKRYPTWPAVVIDPLRQAPQSVLNSCIARTLCVMFFGYSGNGHERVNSLKFNVLFFCMDDLYDVLVESQTFNNSSLVSLIVCKLE